MVQKLSKNGAKKADFNCILPINIVGNYIR